MSFSVDCCQPSCCPTTTVVNVPGVEGPAGTDGTNGTNGQSAFTLTTADFIIPPADDATPVTVAVASTSWMAVGEPLFMPDGLFFIVAAIIDSTHVQVVYPAWESNVNAGNTISAGTKVTPSGWQPAVPALPAIAAISKYASNAGGNYVFTNAYALVTFVTSGAQQITLTTPGTWLLQARARIDYSACTFAAVRNATCKLHRQNNTPADIANAIAAFKTQIITTLTFTAIDLIFPPVMYTTALATDIIEMLAIIDTVPTAGSLDIAEASIVATFLHA